MRSRHSESLPKPNDRERSRQQRVRPVVSICIVNWNCKDLLKSCLRSLQSKLQRVRLEVIVVDNASTDGAAEMVQRRFPRVVLVRNAENVGFARANNQAARLARGRWLFFLNNDTLAPPGALRRLIEYARTHPEIGLLGPRLCDADGRVQISCRRRPTVAALLHHTCLLRWTRLFRAAYRRYRGRDDGGDAVRSVEVLMGAALLVRRGVLREVGGWNEEYAFGGEDIDLCARVGCRRPVVYHPGIEILHYGRASSRQRIGHVYAQTATGLVRVMRKAGEPSAALWLYKLIFTLDAPIHWLRLGCEHLWRRVRGQAAAAERNLVVMRGLAGFLRRGLLEFWRA
jgi:N-acetylglucosaminyl-diphospho-decaprenol L-rhamnosyltransferase